MIHLKVWISIVTHQKTDSLRELFHNSEMQCRPPAVRLAVHVGSCIQQDFQDFRPASEKKKANQLHVYSIQLNNYLIIAK